MKNNKQIINPIGLKGKEIYERQLALMGMSPLTENENKTKSAVELTKMGPDGNAYAIIRENHEYYIKRTNKTTGLVLEDFKYIGGLQNKKDEAYPSYAKAIKQLNLKFKSLAEAYNKGGDINVFEDDNLLNERAFGMGFSNEGNLHGNEEMYTEDSVNEFDEKAMQNFIDQYGEEKGKQIYYATANKQDRNPETFEKSEGMVSFGDDVEPELNEFEAAIEEMLTREDEYVDYTMGNENDPNQLPNPPREINIPENAEGIDHEAYDLVEFLKSKLVERGAEVTPENISLVSLAYPGGTITDLDKISTILSQTNEELSGDQYKIDTNHNGEIEGDDLAALRAMNEDIERLDSMIKALSEGTVKKKVVTKK